MILRNLVIFLMLSFGVASSSTPEKIILTEKNHVSLRGEVSFESLEPIKTRINQLKDGEELYLFIDSPGGSVIAGIELVDILQHSEKKVTCIARKAISMAFSILQACPTRIVLPYSILMQHRISTSLQGSPSEIQTGLEVSKDLEDILNISDSQRLKLTLDQFREKVRYEFWLIGSNKILKNKAADKVGIASCDPELAKKEEIISINMGFFRIEQKINKCPL